MVDLCVSAVDSLLRLCGSLLPMIHVIDKTIDSLSLVVSHSFIYSCVQSPASAPRKNRWLPQRYVTLTAGVTGAASNSLSAASVTCNQVVSLGLG